MKVGELINLTRKSNCSIEYTLYDLDNNVLGFANTNDKTSFKNLFKYHQCDVDDIKLCGEYYEVTVDIFIDIEMEKEHIFGSKKYNNNSMKRFDRFNPNRD